MTGQVRVKVSIGYASIDQDVDSVDCLRRADLAMYEAKRSGSGQRIWDGQIENIG
jgi:GGDEF domain-containing protein